MLNSTMNQMAMPGADTQVNGIFSANMQRGTYNDDNAGISHTSGWLTQSNASFYGGTQHYSKTQGSSITIYFSGTLLKMVYTAGKTYGKVAIQIDTQTPVMLNEHTATTVYRRLWTSASLTSGNHKAVITYYAGNPTNTYVNFDGVIIQ